jgi:hypothetical protein
MGLVHLVLSKVWVLSSTSSAWVVTVLVARRDGEVVPVFFPSSSPSFFLVSMSFFFRFDLQKFKFCAFQKILRNSPLPGASPRLPLLTVTLPICTLSMACQWLDASRAARWSLRAGSGLHNFKKGADKHAHSKMLSSPCLENTCKPPTTTNQGLRPDPCNQAFSKATLCFLCVIIRKENRSLPWVG